MTDITFDYRFAFPEGTFALSGSAIDELKRFGLDGLWDEIQLRAPIADPSFTGIVSLLGGQLSFPPTQNPSSNANTLDDLQEKMRIDGNGNVGIGTTTPAEKLSVNGKIRAKEVKVETANWPDYVFEPSYLLPDLKTTEQFIKENKHLPEIPSAEEVKANGINLGEINAKLLKKVEELTLYLIEQNRRLDAQQKEIEQLKSKQ